MAFKKLRGAVKGYIGSVKDDLNSLTSGLESKISRAGNKFDQRIANSLSDFFDFLNMPIIEL